MPAISLILPVYNGARYLRSALDSVFAQSFTDFELIAVDDCSTDETPEILAEYAAREPRMRVMTNAQNSKLPASLNNGFRVATGEWLSWTSDDNLMRPNMLARLLEVARATPNCDVIYSDFTIIDEKGDPCGFCEVEPAERLIIGNCVGASFLYRREVDLSLGGYDEKLFGVEDYDFWLRAARQFNLHCLHEDLYQYRRHPGSLTSARSRQIHALTAEVTMRELAARPSSRLRAEAYVRLFCSDLYTLRPKLLWLAYKDDANATIRSTGKVLRWIGYFYKSRLLKLH